MTAPRADLLIGQLDMTWSLFEYHAQGLDDADCLWEPAPHCWTVRPDDRGRWVADWQVPEPDPVPVTTVGWLTWHIGFWWTTTLGHCFGDGAPEREEITWPGGATAAVGWLRGLKDDWRAALLPLTDADLDSTDRTATLPWAEKLSLAQVAAWVNFELAKNVAEIGYARHLRRARP
ncbi:DinB family protein [Streptomyces litchfieldiae]|uniref:DinB family protein n=1 Tax=Streptomyces litchfieldiae TaxID=3075543 RepID=A0ABU2MY36_9ACTN|nr:DinB family protein [Streptomyces sp. DSM 44938]MDT0346183.1 DinB family protein [Streptomyces sp. DSM 44938]